MKLTYFAVPYAEDKRLAYAADRLEALGFLRCESSNNADFVLLPAQTKANMLKGLDGKTVFYGGDISVYNGYNYLANESFAIRNAFLTAEGAVACLEENTDFSILGSKILIIGYGRIGKALRHILSGYGCELTVCSRSAVSKEQALFDGCRHILFEQLSTPCGFDVVINTVPHTVLTEKELKAFDYKTVILDLASFPGGVDTLVAQSLGLRLIIGRGMPGRYSPKAAGELIADTVAQIIKEEKL